MVTVLNNPSTPGSTVERSTTIDRSDDSSSGWAVAVIILLAVVAVGGFLWLRYYRAPAATPAAGGTNSINVSLPSVPGTNTGGTGAGTGAAGGNTGAAGTGGATTPTP